MGELVRATLFLFTDDSKIFKKITNNEDKESMQQDLNIMEEWSRKWLLEFQPDKLKCIHMSSKPDEDRCSYKVGNFQVKSVVNDKDLGITVDNRLNFEEHMAQRIKKA